MRQVYSCPGYEVKHYRSTRHWLNPSKSDDTGHIQTETGLLFDRPDEGEHPSLRAIASAEMTIADCSRKITLNFDCYSRKQLAQRRRKIEILKQHLDQVSALLDIYEEESG